MKNFPSILTQLQLPVNNYDIADAIVAREVPKEELITKSPLAKLLLDDKVPKPLTEEEAVVIANQFEVTKKKVEATIDRINSIEERVSKQIQKNDGKIEVTVKDANVKKAIRKVFGTKDNKITYEMYVEAIKARAKFMHQDSKEYINQ
jgi:hypothetical protein